MSAAFRAGFVAPNKVETKNSQYLSGFFKAGLQAGL